jgi:hypothetical protein
VGRCVSSSLAHFVSSYRFISSAALSSNPYRHHLIHNFISFHLSSPREKPVPDFLPMMTQFLTSSLATTTTPSSLPLTSTFETHPCPTLPYLPTSCPVFVIVLHSSYSPQPSIQPHRRSICVSSYPIFATTPIYATCDSSTPSTVSCSALPPLYLSDITSIHPSL